MATNWAVLTSDNLAEVIAIEVLSRSDENIDQDSVESRLRDPGTKPKMDPELATRAQAQIDIAVGQIRAAIRLCHKQPLSVTENAIPPEARRHVLYLAAYGLVNSTLNIQMVLMNDKGAYSPLADNFKKACDYLEAVTKGRNVTPPDDPTGRDYVNPVNVIWLGAEADNPYPAYDDTKAINKPVEPVRFGARTPAVDMTTPDSLFTTLAPYDFPYGNIGQP